MPLMEQSAWPDGSLPAILEPFMWVSTVDPVPGWLVGGTIRVTGMMRGPETVGDSGADIDALAGGTHQQLVNGEARAVRETMYRQAEDAIAAALDAGWVLAVHPEITVKGALSRDSDTGLDVPCAECWVDLHFGLTVS